MTFSFMYVLRCTTDVISRLGARLELTKVCMYIRKFANRLLCLSAAEEHGCEKIAAFGVPVCKVGLERRHRSTRLLWFSVDSLIHSTLARVVHWYPRISKIWYGRDEFLQMDTASSSELELATTLRILS